MNDIVNRILLLLKKENITAKRLCEMLEASPSLVSDWKSGRLKPTIDHIIKLSQILHVSTDYLLTGFNRELPPDERLTAAYDHKGNPIDLSEEQEAYLKGLINQALNERVEEIMKEALKEYQGKKD